MRRQRLILLTLAAGLVLAAVAFADDGSCWQPKRPICPNGVSNEHGRTCGSHSLYEVSDETERTQESFCDGHSRNCQYPDRDCNILRIKDALWNRVYCVNHATGARVFVGWCLNQEFSNTATNRDCSGNKCRIAVSQVD